MTKLKQIYSHNLVDGFKLRGRQSAESCGCDAYKKAKIRQVPLHKTRAYPNPATFVGHSVSTDTKELPYKSIHGYRYAINFVDHKSKLGFVYFLRTKNESTVVLKRYLADMKRLGVTIMPIYSDRGSEFFEKSGDTLQTVIVVYMSSERAARASTPRLTMLFVRWRIRRNMRKFGFVTTSRRATPCSGMLGYLQSFGQTLLPIHNFCLTAPHRIRLGEPAR